MDVQYEFFQYYHLLGERSVPKYEVDHRPNFKGLKLERHEKYDEKKVKG